MNQERTKKLFKVCGVKSKQDLQICEQAGVDLVGLNFVPSSKRCISLYEGKAIIAEQDQCQLVGVFMDQPLADVNQITETLNLDFIQLSGTESLEYAKACSRPVIKGISVRNQNFLEQVAKFQPEVAYILLDGKTPGAGEQFDWQLLHQVTTPYILAGGINLENTAQALQLPNLIGLDSATGTETAGQKDPQKIQQLANLIHND